MKVKRLASFPVSDFALIDEYGFSGLISMCFFPV